MVLLQSITYKINTYLMTVMQTRLIRVKLKWSREMTPKVKEFYKSK